MDDVTNLCEGRDGLEGHDCVEHIFKLQVVIGEGHRHGRRRQRNGVPLQKIFRRLRKYFIMMFHFVGVQDYKLKREKEGMWDLFRASWKIQLLSIILSFLSLMLQYFFHGMISFSWTRLVSPFINRNMAAVVVHFSQLHVRGFLRKLMISLFR